MNKNATGFESLMKRMNEKSLLLKERTARRSKNGSVLPVQYSKNPWQKLQLQLQLQASRDNSQRAPKRNKRHSMKDWKAGDNCKSLQKQLAGDSYKTLASTQQQKDSAVLLNKRELTALSLVFQRKLQLHKQAQVLRCKLSRQFWVTNGYQGSSAIGVGMAIEHNEPPSD